MKTIFLIATKLDNSPIGNQYMLAICLNPDPGLSHTPISDHSYTTLNQLCESIGQCVATEALDVAKLRRDLDNGKQFVAQISEENALCMGFKV